MARKPIKTKKEEIVDYWFSRVDESGLSIDASEAHERCWRCGYEHSLERCHIIPDSLGGEDEPSNLVLLCRRCHLDNPNVTDPQIMWDWIRSYEVPFYDTFWSILGQHEYEFIYGRSLSEELCALGVVEEKEIENTIKSIMDELMKEASYHFGHSYLNTATIAGLYRMLLKRLANQFCKELLPEKAVSKNPWWCR